MVILVPVSGIVVRILGWAFSGWSLLVAVPQRRSRSPLREFVRSSHRFPYAACHCIDASADIDASANACNIAHARS